MSGKMGYGDQSNSVSRSSTSPSASSAGDHAPQPVVEAYVAELHRRGGLGVGPALLGHDGLARRVVRVHRALEGVVPDPGHRVELDQVEDAAWRRGIATTARAQGSSRGKPAEYPVRREDDVEALAAEQRRARHRRCPRRSGPEGPARQPAPAPRRCDASERSSPVTLAPSRAQLSVSWPKWHCRWRSERPRTSPTCSSSMERSELAPALKASSA